MRRLISRATGSNADVRQVKRPVRKARASCSSLDTASSLEMFVPIPFTDGYGLCRNFPEPKASIFRRKLTAFHNAGSFRFGSCKVARSDNSIWKMECLTSACTEASMGGDSGPTDSDAAWLARESASEKYPFRTQVSMNRGISKRSLILSYCSRTTRALFLSCNTESVRVRQAAADSSSAGRLVVSSASREEDKESREDVRALVVLCKARKVG
jgi:hypothetical protein